MPGTWRDSISRLLLLIGSQLLQRRHPHVHPVPERPRLRAVSPSRMLRGAGSRETFAGDASPMSEKALPSANSTSAVTMATWR